MRAGQVQGHGGDPTGPSRGNLAVHRVEIRLKPAGDKKTVY